MVNQIKPIDYFLLFFVIIITNKDDRVITKRHPLIYLYVSHIIVIMIKNQYKFLWQSMKANIAAYHRPQCSSTWPSIDVPLPIYLSIDLTSKRNDNRTTEERY